MAPRLSLVASRFTLYISDLRPRRNTSFWIDAAVVAAIFAVTATLYAASIGYLFVWQDATDVVHAIKRSPIELMTGVANHPYYRPLFFLAWKLILSYFGSGSAFIFHMVLVGAHLTNAVMLYALVRDLTRRRLIAVAAALLFATYPFSYQAVTWAIAQQPPSTTFVLAALLIYTRTRLTAGNRIHHLAALLCLVAAMLLHESAFVGAAILLAVEVYLVLSRRVPRISFWPLTYFAITFAMLALYSTATTAQPPAKPLDPLTGLYLLQSLTYPTSMILARVCQAAACDSLAWLLPIGGLTLLALVFAWQTGRTMLIGMFGLVWFGLGVAPIWARLDYAYYVQYGARLFYLAGAGAALAMAALLGVTPKRWSRAIRVGLIAMICLQGGLFVVGRQRLYTEAFNLLDQGNQAMLAPDRGPIVFIDTVDLIAYRDPEFPLGWFGIFAAPWHNRIGEAPHLRANNAEWVVDLLHAQDVQTRSSLALEFHGSVLAPQQFRAVFSHANRVYRVEALDSGLRLIQVAEIERGLALRKPSVAVWAGPIRLLSAWVEVEAGIPVLNLDWLIDGPIEPGLTVFVHVRNESGDIVSQADGDLIGGLAPLSGWSPGDLVHERRPLLLPYDLAAGDYTVAIGLYDRASLRRTAPIQADGVPVVDGAAIVARFDYPIQEAY